MVVCLCVGLVMDCLRIEGVRYPLPNGSWDRIQPPTTLYEADMENKWINNCKNKILEISKSLFQGCPGQARQQLRSAKIT